MEIVLTDSMQTNARGGVPVLPPPGVSARMISDEHGALYGYLVELDGYYDAIKKFAIQEPDEVLQQIAGFAARLCEIRALLQRNSSTVANKLRTREVDPLLEQMEFQFKIASRLLTMRQMEWDASKGGT